MQNWKKISAAIIVAGVVFFIGYEGVPYVSTKIEEFKNRRKSKKLKQKFNKNDYE